MSERGGVLSDRPWLRAWLVVGLAAWVAVGIVLVDRATRQGLVEDVSFSPYHVVGYAALVALAAYVVWTFFRALRRGDWRRAFPPMYGGLGLGFLLLLGWIVLDIVWRETLGINDNVEGGLAPPRLLLPMALVVLAAGPVREAIADRARPGISAGELPVRWAGVVGAGVMGAALTLTAFNPVRDALNDYATNPGVDASEIWTMAADGSGQTRLVAARGDGVDSSLPAWSPDGERIAYTVWTNAVNVGQNLDVDDQTTAIWTIAADGSDPREVVRGDLVVASEAGQTWIPAWSPDGGWIAYTLSPTGVQGAPAAEPLANPAPGQVGPPSGSAGASIWVIRPDGSGKARLTAPGVDALGATWSPDGTQIAYVATGTGGSSDIHVASINVGAPGVQPEGPPTLGDDRVLAADPANDWAPAWSPDGTKIAFTSNRAGYDGIWITPVDGRSLEQFRVETQPGPTGFNDWVPAFSPDGASIAWVSDQSGEPEIYASRVTGDDFLNLSNHPQHFDGQWSIAWSPDGTRLAYATGSFGDAAGSGWVREDYAAAQAILFGLALSIVALLIVALGAPLGSMALALLIVVAMAALATDAWRFLPGALVAGLLVDGLVRSVRLRLRARVAAAALPGFANLAIGLTIGSGSTLAWSLTLLLGVAAVSAVVGWGLAEAVERLLQRPNVAAAAAPREANRAI